MRKYTENLLTLDLKDQKIFVELFKNGRAPYSTISKNSHMSKDVVRYRIDKLIKEGIMTNITTIIDIKKLGWSSSLVFFKFMNLDKIKIKQFISCLIENPFVVEILEFAGSWDFAASFQHKDTLHLNQIVSNLETNFPFLIDHYSIFFISENIFLPYNVLFEKYAFQFPSIKIQPYKTDNLDLKILSALSTDGRKSLASLEEELNENRMTIYYRMKKMIKSGLIQHFRPNMFTEKLGLHWYIIKIKLSNRSDKKIKVLINRLKSFKQTNYIILGFGAADIIFHMQVKVVQELQDIIYMLREDFSDEIKSIEFDNTIKDYKFDFFPKGLLREIGKCKGV